MNATAQKILLPVAICLFSCSDPAKQTPAKAVETKPDSVLAFKLDSVTIEKTVALPGELLPYEKVQVFGKVPGYVKKMFVDIGSIVAKGQVIATLEAPEMQSRIAQSKQQLA